METRTLGGDGPALSVVGIGCNNFGMRIDADATRAVVHAALDAGITHFDTAEMYGGGKSEEFLGDALGSRRDEVVIASKFLPRPKDEPGTPGALKRRVLEGAEISLKRLGTDRIDLYYQHYPDPDLPVEEALEALDELVRDGKVLHVASSNFSASQITDAASVSASKGWPRFCGTQIEWNLLQRGVEDEVVPAARANGLGIIPYFPLASGLLSGKYRKGEPFPEGSRLSFSSYFAAAATDENFDRIEALTTFAEERGHTILELAIAWLAAQDGVASVIAGATKPEQVVANAQGGAWTLTADDLAALPLPPAVTGLRAVVVGTSFGGRIHVPALRAAGIDVHALVGRDGDRTRQRAAELDVPHAHTSLAEALADGEAACVTVSTPPDAHAPLVLEALAAGRHVLCEKPFAADVGEAQAMADAAEAAGVVALVGCEFRFVPAEEVARRTIASGAIGTPRLATYVQHSRLLTQGLHGAFNAEWWFDAERGGGILGGGGIHYVDRFRTWLGEVAAVSAFVEVVGDRPRDQADDTYTVLLRFASGVTGVLQHCAATHAEPLRACRVVGTQGTVSLEPAGAVVHDAAGSHPIPEPDELAPEPPPARTDDPKHTFTWLELPPYTRLAERFRDLVLGERPPADAPPSPTFADALRGQRVLDAIRASSRAGGAWTDC